MSASRFRLSAIGLARRQVTRMLKSPPLLLAPLLFPLLLFGAFAGGLSVLGAVPTFDYPDYTTFQFVWVLLVGVAMAGMSVGLALAQDFEAGFARRILLATSRRTPIVAGYVLAGVALAIVASVLLFAIGLAVGMTVTSNVLDLLGLIGLVLLFNISLTLWGIGVALRTRSTQAGPLLQTPVFIAVFLLPVYTTRDLLAGWVKAVANVNPLTPVLESGRSLIIGEPHRVVVAFAVSAGLVILFALWAVTGLRSAEEREGIRARAKRRRALRARS
jgi:ABC-2 type transport system permease protein